MKNIWEQKGNLPCSICGKGVAQRYSDKKDGKYVSDACWNCLYKK